ncbi:MAG: hypothetical protein QM770_07850 [Tepidisphaeraceae bacterium]
MMRPPWSSKVMLLVVSALVTRVCSSALRGTVNSAVISRLEANLPQ